MVAYSLPGHFTISFLIRSTDPISFVGLSSGLALFVEEQTNRREYSHCHWEDAGGEPGTMGA